VSVRLRDGGTRERITAMARGNPANPMTDEELDDKFLRCATPLLGGRATAVLADLHHFATLDDVGGWLDSLR